MDDFLAASLSFPTVVFTVLMLITMAYWLLVIVGAMGLDVLDFDHDHAGGADGHGGDGGTDVDVDHGHSGEGLGVLPTLLWVLKLNSVPMTIVLSLMPRETP